MVVCSREPSCKLVIVGKIGVVLWIPVMGLALGCIPGQEPIVEASVFSTVLGESSFVILGGRGKKHCIEKFSLKG